MPRPASQKVPTDAVLTVPNLVTFARIALIPVFLWLALGAENTAAAFVVGAVAGWTDYLDGILARRLGQVSRLGIAMDPFVDRLLIASAAVVLIVRDFAPLWAVLVVVGRDAAVLAAVPLVRRGGVALPPVSRAGKAATMGLMWAFGLFIGAHIADPPAGWVRTLAWIFYAPGVALSYAAAAMYARDLRRALASR